jgi:hypothetical protein
MQRRPHDRSAALANERRKVQHLDRYADARVVCLVRPAFLLDAAGLKSAITIAVPAGRARTKREDRNDVRA